MKQNILLLAIIMLYFNGLNAQNDTTTQYIHGLFHGKRLINGQSLETQLEGELDFYIGHRFGAVSGGIYELFGLDQATMRMGFEYGIKDWLAVGVGRSTYGKYGDAFLKWRLLRQSTGKRTMPISATWHSSLAINGLKATDGLPILFSNRLSYAHQLLVGRKFSDAFSLQVMPTLLHQNLVATPSDPNDIFSMGGAFRYRLSQAFALTTEFYWTPNRPAGTYNALALGFDIDTGSHVFQLQVTNSRGMIEKIFLSETAGAWADGDVHFGFNMFRTFKLKGRRY